MGVGLLALSTSGLPAALADDAATEPTVPDVAPDAPAPTRAVLVAAPEATPVAAPLVADFGTGKQFDLALEVDGDVPDGSGLAGARFAFTPPSGTKPAAICTTTKAGTCTVSYASSSSNARTSGSVVDLTSGTYAISQVAAVDGLLPASGVVGTFTMVQSAYSYDPNWNILPVHKAVKITNVSQYSQRVAASVVDAETGDPLEGASFSLAEAGDAPARLRDTAEAVAVDELSEGGVVSSDEDGVVAFDGWFLPGDLTLTPRDVPAGYVLGEQVDLTVPATPGFHAPVAWVLDEPLRIAPVPVQPEQSTGAEDPTPVATPSTPATPTPTTPTASDVTSAPSAVAAPPASGSPSSGGGGAAAVAGQARGATVHHGTGESSDDAVRRVHPRAGVERSR